MVLAGARVGGRVLLPVCSTQRVDTLSNCMERQPLLWTNHPLLGEVIQPPWCTMWYITRTKLRIQLCLFKITDIDEAFEKKYTLLFSRSNSSGTESAGLTVQARSHTKAGKQPPDESWPVPEHLSMTTLKANICLCCWRAHATRERLLTNSQELAGRVLKSKRINSVPGT